MCVVGAVFVGVIMRVVVVYVRCVLKLGVVLLRIVLLFLQVG